MPSTTERLFGPPAFVVNGPLQSAKFGSRTHHHTHANDDAHNNYASWWWTAKGDWQDLIYNELLRFLLPTYQWGHARKFTLVTLMLVGLCVWTLVQGFSYDDQQGSDSPKEETTLPLSNIYNMASILSLIILLSWIAYMMPTLQALRCEWMNPGVTHRHREPMHVPLGMYTSIQAAREGACQWELPARTESSMNDSNNHHHHPNTTTDSNIWRLDSQGPEDESWLFRLFPTVEAALEMVETLNNKHNTNTDTDNLPNNSDKQPEWKPMVVPSNWTRQGYDKPIYTNHKYPFPCQPPMIPVQDNPTGIYRRTIQLPSDWSTTDGSEYSLILHGAESAVYVYLNGRQVGFSKDSRLPCEFNVTPYLHNNDNKNNVNELTIVVMRWSDGSYLEDQDHWWMAGLYRSVELVRRPPKADILQYMTQASADGQLNVQVYCRKAASNAARHLTFQVFQDQHTVASSSADNNILESGPCIWKETVRMDPHVDCCTISGVVDNIQQWTAETPHLYTLVISLGYDDEDDDAKQIYQSESCRIGFRTISITNGQLLVNNRAITVCGMNRHEHDPDHGKTITIESIQLDVSLLKQNNFNAVRTSHYPNRSAFYRICDYYGLYVCDEANIETHGMKPMGRLAHCPGWEAGFVSRVTRLVERDYNHPSVIFWSMGNEAGRGRNLVKARRLVQQLDNSRPILYESGGGVAEGTGRTELTDIVNSMYPSVPLAIDHATRVDDDRPVILCEYSHAMGNSNGNLHLYWEEVWNKEIPRFQGGFIWDMIDQGLRVPQHASEGFYFAYGGDFGDTINDRQFCINGMFTPDREPHPAVAEIKFLQQPVIFHPKEAYVDSKNLRIVVSGKAPDYIATVTLNVQNRYTFRDLSHLTWSWQLISNRSVEPIRKKNFEVPMSDTGDATLDLGSAISRVLQLERTKPEDCENSYFLNIRGRLSTDQPWAGAGHLLASQQFHVRFVFTDISIPPRTPIKPRSRGRLAPEIVAESMESCVKVSLKVDETSSFLAAFDKATGCLISYCPHGKNVLTAPLGPNFCRAATDNDKGGMELVLEHMFPFEWVKDLFQKVVGNADFSYHSHWSLAGLTPDRPPVLKCREFSITENDAESYCSCKAHVEVRHAVFGNTLMDVELTWSIFVDGKINLRQIVRPRKIMKRLSSLPRVGCSMQLDPSLYLIHYYGRGPTENYPDRKSGSEMGQWASTVADFGYPNYIVPGENGSRSDCEWLLLRAEIGEGLLVVADHNNFSCSALCHTPEELDKAEHTCDLSSAVNGTSPVNVCIDHKIMGVGGDNSWFPVVYKPYLINPQETFEYSITIRPMEKDEDPAATARDLQRQWR